MPSGINIIRGLFVFCPEENPFCLLSKSFWHNGHPNLSFEQAMSMISLLHIFHKSTTTLPISEFRCYGLCQACEQCEGQNNNVDLKWEHNTKKGVNGMIRKRCRAIKFISSNIFYTIARKKNKQKEH